ncbi:MAG: type II secretion system GspH family protein [Phycisphaerales bacterium]|nr:type II secretion system GspH family protein [Phycisphaerales bacterium]
MRREEGNKQSRRLWTGHRCGNSRSGFSLLEMLVVISVIAILLAIMLPALQSCRRAGRNLKCVSQLKTVAFEFRTFADDLTVRTRGDSDQYGSGRFEIDDFQNMMYRVDEFWDVSDPNVSTVQYEATREAMMCPEAPSKLIRAAGDSKHYELVFPDKNISIALNRRLYRPPPAYFPALVTGKILDYPDVPLAMDVDGLAMKAADQSSNPFYLAPPVEGEIENYDFYATGKYWFPSFRHGRTQNVAFVGGHVDSSERPVTEPGWRWSYVPESDP